MKENEIDVVFYHFRGKYLFLYNPHGIRFQGDKYSVRRYEYIISIPCKIEGGGAPSFATQFGW